MELTMSRRKAVTKKKALAYWGADRAGKAQILDDLVELNRLAPGLRQGSAAPGSGDPAGAPAVNPARGSTAMICCRR
jgi:hypothetical protein